MNGSGENGYSQGGLHTLGCSSNNLRGMPRHNRVTLGWDEFSMFMALGKERGKTGTSRVMFIPNFY